MGQTTYCCGLHPNGSVILIAAVDIILALCFFLLSSLALADLQKVSDLVEKDLSYAVSVTEEDVQAGINEFTHIHGQIVLVLLKSLISLFLSLGLLVGVRKDWDCPIKAWLINGCVMVLLGVISLFVLVIVTCQWKYLLLGVFLPLRVYEMWVVFDFLRISKFTSASIARTASSERLHNV